MERENIQNQHRAVDDAHIEYILQIADLGERKLIVKNDKVDSAVVPNEFGDFLRLARADIGPRVGGRRILDDAGGLDATGGFEQPRQLVQRGGQPAFGEAAGLERDEHGARLRAVGPRALDEHGTRAPFGVRTFRLHKNTPFTNKKAAQAKTCAAPKIQSQTIRG